jgi:GTP pyrophosphokinase
MHKKIEALVEDFKKKLTSYTPEEQHEINAGVEFALACHGEQRRASGEPYIMHPLAVAALLIDLRLDHKTIVAAVCHDVLEDTTATAEELRRKFGKEVELLVDGVTKITSLYVTNQAIQSAETIRKMFFAMVKDIRVILIKLADKLHNMRTLEYLEPERRRRIAEECLEIYAPLAGRLGISSFKDELEDLALKTLHQDAYDQIKQFVAARRSERAEYLSRIEKALNEAAAREEISIEVKTRAKHFYSIYQKMKRKNKSLDEIYDLLGIRILCKTPAECYGMLGIVHRLWMPIGGRFKDYIAMPKANRYQSLHTTVMCYEGKLIEIQIRTHEMNQLAEYGIAAHWLYKSNKRLNDPRELSIINKLKNWTNEQVASSTFLEEIKSELLKDSIYVFTPKGDVVELPQGATPLDFAYHIHTEVGNHCQGAFADGKILPLKMPLRNTQVVKIITSPKAKPHLSWLRMVRTARARSKIKNWLNKYDEKLTGERSLATKKADAPLPATALREKHKASEAVDNKLLDQKKVGIKIGKEHNIMIKLAGCCTPTIGDAIIGYVSRGRGIIIHKENCPNLKFIRDFAERHISVEWETMSPKTTKRLRVIAREDVNLFSEIETAIRKYHGHLISGKLDKNEKGILTGFFVIEIDDKEHYKEVIKALRTIPAIINIQTNS